MLWNQTVSELWMFPLQARLPGWVIYLIIILAVLLIVWAITRISASGRRREEEDVMRRSASDRQEAADQTMAQSRQTTAETAYNAQDKTPPASETTPVPVTSATQDVVAPETPVMEGPVEVVNPPATEQPVAEDDLEIIEGIGPKIAQMLHEQGIHTFDQLAHTSTDRLTSIVRSAGLTLSDPTSWPEQARLAAAGDMEGLKNYQDKLKGGREV